MVVDSLFIVAPIVCGGSVWYVLFCYAVHSVVSSFAITLIGNIKLVAFKFNCLPDVV